MFDDVRICRLASISFNKPLSVSKQELVNQLREIEMYVEYKPELFLPAWTRHDGTNQEEETLYVVQSMPTAQKAALMLVLCLHEAP